MNRRSLLLGGAALSALAAVPKAFGNSAFFQGQVPDGPFLPFWESLKACHCPDWFRDAKFGIWAHWSLQFGPEQGDWYARNMYIQGQPQYEYQVKIELLGAKSDLQWTRGEQGLKIPVPNVPPCKYAYSFRILSS